MYVEKIREEDKSWENFDITWLRKWSGHSKVDQGQVPSRVGESMENGVQIPN